MLGGRPLSQRLLPAAAEGAAPFPCLCPSQAEAASSHGMEGSLTREQIQNPEIGSFRELARSPLPLCPRPKHQISTRAAVPSLPLWTLTSTTLNPCFVSKEGTPLSEENCPG